MDPLRRFFAGSQPGPAPGTREHFEQDTSWIQEPEEPPPPLPPSYATAPQYQHPNRVYRHSSHTQLMVASVSRKPGRAQPIALRRPFDFDSKHGTFFHWKFELHSIPDHAMGVAFVNYRDARYALGRVVDRDTVFYRGWHGWTHGRLRLFVQNAMQSIGTRHPNSTRWFYFRYDPTYHTDHGPHPLFV